MFRKILFFCIVFIVTFFILEVSLRIIGFRPYQLPIYSFESEPTPCFGYNEMGICLLPGAYQLTINDGLYFNATHTKDSCRISSSLEEEKPHHSIAMLGCSYTYGTGVSDHQTYPYLLNEKLQNVAVKNYSVPSYGTIQHYLQLEKILQKHTIPEVIIVNYATFHEERNMLSRNYQFKLKMGMELHNKQLEQLIFPSLKIQGEEFQIVQKDVLKSYRPFPFRKKLAIFNAFDELLNQMSTNKIKNLDGSKLLLKQMNEMCLAHNTTLIVADIDYSSASEEIASFCTDEDIAYVNISPNFKENGFRNLPYDNHPNFKAHKFYADKMFDYLEKNKLIQ